MKIAERMLTITRTTTSIVVSHGKKKYAIPYDETSAVQRAMGKNNSFIPKVGQAARFVMRNAPEKANPFWCLMGATTDKGSEMTVYLIGGVEVCIDVYEGIKSILVRAGLSDTRNYRGRQK